MLGNVKYHSTQTKSSSPHTHPEIGCKSTTIIQESWSLVNCWMQTSVLDSNTAKNPRRIFGITRKSREQANQKASIWHYIFNSFVTTTWKLWSFCLSMWQRCSWIGKDTENSEKVGQWYKRSLESEKIKQTGIFQPEKTMSEVEYNTQL